MGRRLMGPGSRRFLPLRRELTAFVLPWGPPHDSSQSVQNELDFDGFCEVSGRPSKNSFSGSRVRVAIEAPRKLGMFRVALRKIAFRDPGCGLRRNQA